MASDFQFNLPSKSVIFDLIKKKKYKEALSVAEKRFDATGELYDLPPLIALRKKVYGIDDKEANKYETSLLKYCESQEKSQLASAYYEVGLDDLALEALFRVLESTRFNDAYPKIIDIYTRKGKFDKIEELEKKYKFDRSSSFEELNEIIENKHNMTLEEKVSKLEAIVEKDPTYYSARNELAQAYIGVKRYDDAIKNFEVLEDTSDNYYAIAKSTFYKALCKYYQGKFDESLYDLQMIQMPLLEAFNPLYNRILKLKANLNRSLRRILMETAMMEELVKRDPLFDHYLRLANLYKCNFDNVKTKETYIIALEHADTTFKQSIIYYNLALVCIRLGEYKEALDYCRKSSEDFEFYQEHETELYNISATVSILLNEHTETDITKMSYLEGQSVSYDRDRALTHIAKHKEKLDYKELHTVFLPNIDVNEVLEYCEEKIKDKNPTSYDISDLYEIEYKEPVANIDGYDTKKLLVVSVINTKNIITIFPVELLEEEKILIDNNKTKVVSTRPSAIDKFNMKYNRK